MPEHNQPVPVKLCRVCWTTHHVDTPGTTSLELEEWYASEACRHVRRLKTGLLTQQDNPGVFKEVLAMIDKHYDPEVIRARKAKVLARFEAREERPVATVINGRQADDS